MFVPCLFSSLGYLKVMQFFDALFSKTFGRYFYCNVGQLLVLVLALLVWLTVYFTRNMEGKISSQETQIQLLMKLRK